MDQKEQPILYLRWVLIASLAYMILFGENAERPSDATLLYVALLFASNILIPRLPYRNPRTFGSVLLTFDTAFVLVGLLLSGSTTQDLLIGYFLCIVMATFGDSEKRIAAAAVLVTGVYGIWIFANLDPVHRPSLMIRLPFLFVTTIFYGYMMERVRGEHAGRVRAEARVRGLDCLLQVTRSFSSSLASEEVLERVAATLRTTLQVEKCRIQMIPGVGTADSVVAEAIERRAPVVVSAASPERKSVSVLALPIVHGFEPLAVLVVEAERAGGTFHPEEIEFCQVIANAAASALKNARQYETLAEIERAKSEFLSNLSHELRTPISVILGYSELAAEYRERMDPDLGSILDSIARSALEMAGHVEGLLQLSQLTLGREHREVGPVDLPGLLENALQTARRVARRRTIDLELRLDPGLGEIYADGGKLSRIVQHILMNAVKFTERGSIQLSAALVQSGVELRLPEALQPWERLLSVAVRDTGIGIAPEQLERIFQEFRQVDGSTTRHEPGLGLGLAICRRLVETLGGAIRVESRPGEGSVFEILVPIRTAA